MKIAILTSGILPVPAVKGGAVENHIDFYLKANDRLGRHDMTVYSIANEATKGHPALQSRVNHYVYIEGKSLWARIRKHLGRWVHGEGYYHYTIEYFFRQAWRRARREHYDMIVLDNRPGYAASMEVPEGTKLVLYLHNDLLNSETRDAQTIYRKADRILTVSDYIAGRVRTIDPHDRKCIAVLNGIDRKAFAPGTDDDRREGRRKMGFADEDFVMVFSGRMAKEKGIGELIEAMGALADRPDIKLLVVGSPFYGDTADEDDFVRELKRKAQAVEGRIRFTGFVGYAQMPAYLRMADIAVVPSLWDDPCPNTVLEAQATGLPLITTRRGGIPEEVTEEGAVMLDTDEHFTERLTEAIVALHDDPERRRRMATAQLQHAAYYTTERYTEDFFRAIEKPFTD